AIGMIGQVGDDVASSDLHQPILHELGLDEEIRIDRLELGDERAANEPVEICAGNQSHERITSLKGVKDRLKAVATPGWVTLPSKVLSQIGRASCRERV